MNATLPRGEHGKGRRVPPDWVHVERYGLAKHAKVVAPKHVNIIIPVPKDIKDVMFQNGFNGCTGASTAELMTTLNTPAGNLSIPYSWFYVWNEAKKIDEWSDTNPGDNEGSSVRAALDVARKFGMVTRKNSRQEKSAPKNPVPNPDDGIVSNWWATDVDEIRAVVASNIPVVLGTAWTDEMSNPVYNSKDNTFRMPDSIKMGRNMEGHAWMIHGMNDDRQCGYMCNTWSSGWPGKGVFDVEVPYSLIKQLLDAEGECGVVVDKVIAKKIGLREMPHLLPKAA